MRGDSLQPSHNAQVRSRRWDRRRQADPLRLLDRDVVTGIGMTQTPIPRITIEHSLQPLRGRRMPSATMVTPALTPRLPSP